VVAQADRATWVLAINESILYALENVSASVTFPDSVMPPALVRPVRLAPEPPDVVGCYRWRRCTAFQRGGVALVIVKPSSDVAPRRRRHITMPVPAIRFSVCVLAALSLTVLLKAMLPLTARVSTVTLVPTS